MRTHPAEAIAPAHPTSPKLTPPDLDSDKHLRHVRLEHGYTLRTWDTYERAPTGQNLIGYHFCAPDGTVLFEGEDYGCAPSHGIDSDDALRGLLGFITLRPGDTDADYFDGYTDKQFAFCHAHAEELAMYALEDIDEPFAFENLDDWTED